MGQRGLWRMNVFQRAYGGLAQYRGAVELGWYDFSMGYRRSLLGPIWIAVQFLVWLSALTLILHAELGNGLWSYAAYVGTGMFVWEPIAASMQDGARHLSQQSVLLKSVPVPLSYISVRKLAFIVFRASVTLPIIAVVLLMSGAETNISVLALALPALALILISMYCIIVLFGFVGVYNRDFEFFLPAVTRFLFFVTPIFWHPTDGLRKAISDFNPFTYYLDIIRSPLLGTPPSQMDWIVVGSFTAAGVIAALIVHFNFRKSVIFWI